MYIYVCIHITCIYTYVYIYAYMIHIYIYVQTYIFIHTYLCHDVTMSLNGFSINLEILHYLCKTLFHRFTLYCTHRIPETPQKKCPNIVARVSHVCTQDISVFMNRCIYIFICLPHTHTHTPCACCRRCRVSARS